MSFFTPPFRASALSLMLALGGSSLAQAQTPSWQLVHGLGLGTHYPGGAAVDAAGNMYEAGSFNASLTLGSSTYTSAGSLDGYLAKFRPDGSVAWVRHLSSSSSEAVNDVALDAFGNVYISGRFSGAVELGNGLTLNQGSTTASKGFVIRYSPEGKPEWVQQSLTEQNTFVDCSNLRLDGHGNVCVVGLCGGKVGFGSTTLTIPGPSLTTGVYIARFAEASGELSSLTSAISYPTRVGNTISYNAPRMTVASSGDLFLFTAFEQPVLADNTTYTTQGDRDIFIAKYNIHGALQWATQLGGAAADGVSEGAVDTYGNLYLSGGFTTQATVGSTTLTSNGGYDGYLVKFSPNGGIIWARTFGGPGSDGWSDLVLDSNANPTLAGNFSEGALLGTTSLAHAGNRDALVASYKPDGQISWYLPAGSSDYDIGSYLGYDANRSLHVMGVFSGTCAFGSTSLTTSLPREYFLGQISGKVLANQPAHAFTTALFPNPASNVVNLPSLPVGTVIQVVDGIGRVVRSATSTASSQLSVQGLVPGLYTIQVTDKRGVQFTSRLQVQ